MKNLKIGLLLGGLLVGIFFVYAVFNFRNASSKQATLADEWRQTTGISLEELVAAYPKTEKNESAQELERLAAKLEINESEDGEGEGSLLARYYFGERQTGAGGEAEELPEYIKEYLAIHHDDLDALYSFVRQNSRPEWETNVSRRAETPMPNLSFHINLHEIIALDVLNRTRQNQNRQALEAFEASRKASEFFRERPEVYFQMINLMVSSTQNDALRKMNDVPTDWRKQMATDDYRRLAVKVLEYEFGVVDMSADSKYSTTLQKVANKLFRFSPLNSPLDTSAVVRETVAELQRRDFCSLSNLNGDEKLAWWNAEGRILFPSALQMWRNFAQMSYDAELTERVLRLKEFRRASPQSDLPPELSRTSSALCDGSNWTAEKQPDGSLVIRFSRAGDFIGDKKTSLSYTLPAGK